MRVISLLLSVIVAGSCGGFVFFFVLDVIGRWLKEAGIL